MSTIVTSVAATLIVAQGVAAPTSTAAPCTDAEVVFARGTTELPGAGPTGDAFIDTLRTRVGAKSVGVYAVDYPATMAFSTAVDGIADARAHILTTVAKCPTTKLVLGGFSQGAAVMGFVTAGVVPEGVSPTDVPAPMPPEVASHVAAVALFGKPSPRFMKVIKDPDVVVGPIYVGKTIDLCVDNDLVCDPHGRSFSVHDQYAELGFVDQGADFAAQRLLASWAADAAEEGADAESPVTPSPAQPAPTPNPLSAVDQSPSDHLAPMVPTAPGPAPGPDVAGSAATI